MQRSCITIVLFSLFLGAASATSSVSFCGCVFSVDSAQLLSRTGDCSDCGSTSLDLSGMGIRSVSANTFKTLFRLELLVLSENKLTALPEDAFAGLSKLQVLALDRNQLANLPEKVFDGLSGMMYIFLYSNMLAALPEKVFAGLSKLNTLSLYDNRLPALPEKVFDGLSGLSEMFLHGNKLTSLPEKVFAGLSRISRLDLNDNQIIALPEKVFAGLSFLNVLHLHNNQLAALPQQIFSGLSSLTLLHLSSNNITALPVAVFADLARLETLQLDQNRIYMIQAQFSDGLSNLKWLHLQNNYLESISPEVFVGLSSLQRLHLFNNLLSTLPPFPALPSLQVVDVSANKLSWLPKGIFDSLPELQTVILSGNRLTWLPFAIFFTWALQSSFFVSLADNPLICSPFLPYSTPLPSTSKCPFDCYPGDFVLDMKIFDLYEKLPCLPCPPGTFSSQPGSACTACQQGAYSSNALGAVDASTCLPCGAGNYSSVGGANSSDACLPCAAGSYSTLHFASGCGLCMPGTFASGIGSTACTVCAPGTYTSAYGVPVAGGCAPCAAGSYGTGVGESSASACVLCAGGKYGIDAGAISAAVCVPCPAAGLYSMVGQSSCLACSPGTYSTSGGSSSCLQCEAGTYSSVRSGTNCTRCKPGTYLTAQGAASSTACVPCEAGLFSMRSGATDASTCQKCATGTFAVSGYSACIACAAGTYAVNSGVSACDLCTSGATTLRLGASAIDDCMTTSSLVTIKMQVLLPTSKAAFLEHQDAYKAAVGATARVDPSYVTVLDVVEGARRQILRSVQVNTSVVAGPSAAARLVLAGTLDANLMANGLPNGTVNVLSVTNNTIDGGQQQEQAAPQISARTIGIIVGSVVGGAVFLFGSAGLLTWLRFRKDPYPLSAEERRQLCEAARTTVAVEKGASKLCEEAYELKTGQPVQAARGLGNLLRVDAEHLHSLIAKGVDGILEEVRLLAETGGEAERDVLELTEYILYQNSSEKEYPNGIRDKGRNGVDFSYFTTHVKAKEALLTPAEILAMRLYTTAAYRLMNNPLRDQKRHEEQRACPLPVTTYFAVEGIKKLRANNVKKKGDAKAEAITLWRGMRNLKVAERFMEEGGTELAFMSTTTQAEVAVRYSLSAQSLLFKIEVPSFMQTGADIQWLSAFPGEAEMLYPPLTYLRPSGRTEDIEVSRPDGLTVHFHVVEVTPTIA